MCHFTCPRRDRGIRRPKRASGPCSQREYDGTYSEADGRPFVRSELVTQHEVIRPLRLLSHENVLDREAADHRLFGCIIRVQRRCVEGCNRWSTASSQTLLTD